MESCNTIELSEALHSLSLTNLELDERSKNKKYDEQFFPKHRKVVLHVDHSPRRFFWQSSEESSNWCSSLIQGTKQFNNVAYPLIQSIGSYIRICDIYKIRNKFLERQFELKKQLKRLSGPCVEYRMYHFTVYNKVKGIITNNFNWRYSGLSRGHKYGHGISFSPDPKFAEQFCKSKVVKVLLVANVLVSSVQLGTEDMVLPHSGFDTTVSPKNTVYVKFEDSEFYPKYLVYYYRV